MDIRKMFGKTFKSNFGDFILTGEIDNSKTPRRYEIKFINTNYKKFALAKYIKTGKIRDPYFKAVDGIACTGIWEKTNINKQLRSVWGGMIKRCYNKNHEAYIRYGKKGIYVSKEWLCFENFLKDVTLVEGWNKERFLKKELELDKDIKGKNCYSKENCKWVSFKENNKGKSNEKSFLVNGEKINGLLEFCRKNNLPPTSVQRAIKNNRIYKGFKFNKFN